MGAPAEPINGPVVKITAAKASIAAERVLPLLDRVQDHLDHRAATIAREYELAYKQQGQAGYFVDEAFWQAVGARVDLDRRELDAVRRAHNEQLRHAGRRQGRRAEIESALEIRDCVLVNRNEDA